MGKNYYSICEQCYVKSFGNELHEEISLGLIFGNCAFCDVNLTSKDNYHWIQKSDFNKIKDQK